MYTKEFTLHFEKYWSEAAGIFPLPPNPSARLLSAIHLQFAFLNGLVIFG
jgi:hypothetical protein